MRIPLLILCILAFQFSDETLTKNDREKKKKAEKEQQQILVKQKVKKGVCLKF